MLKSVLLYTSQITPRLHYVCHWVFQEVAGLPFEITNSLTVFSEATETFRINYSYETIDAAHVHWVPAGFLFENNIREIVPVTFEYKNKPCMFSVKGGHSAFDVLSAVFYCISRYEEYSYPQRDLFQRYPHTASWAFRQGVLNRPLVDEWLMDLFQEWQVQFPALVFQILPFEYIPTYDIDIAFSYQGKPWYKQLAAWGRGEFSLWWQWKMGKTKDPYDAYDELDQWHKQYQLQPIYFMLLSGGGAYNKNLPVQGKSMQTLLTHLKQRYTVGLHPSYADGDTMKVWANEKQVLGEVQHTRQHYIRFTLPATYRELETLGFEHEYSMGYGSINGFRASTSRSFLWYDLEQERVSTMRVHPFCFMECNARFEQGLSVEQAAEELVDYENKVRAVSGTLITIWHNFALGADPNWTGWKEVYKASLNRLFNS